MMIGRVTWRQFWRLFTSLSKLCWLHQKLLACRCNTLTSNFTRRSRRSKARRPRAATAISSYRIWIFLRWNRYTRSIFYVNNGTLNCKKGARERDKNKKGIYFFARKTFLIHSRDLNCKFNWATKTRSHFSLLLLFFLKDDHHCDEEARVMDENWLLIITNSCEQANWRHKRVTTAVKF